MTTLPKIVSEIMDTCHHASEKCMFGVRGWSNGLLSEFFHLRTVCRTHRTTVPSLSVSHTTLTNLSL